MPGPLVLAGVAGGLSLLGGLAGNRASAKEGARNRAFQERMRNSQWQASVTDLEAAGLNPAIAYSQGPNASPGGSMASQNDIGTPAVNSAMQARTMAANLKLLEEQRQVAMATARKTRAEGTQAEIATSFEQARMGYYFDGSGRPNDALRKLLDSNLSGAMATNAKSVADFNLAQLSIPERKAMADLFKRMGEGGKGVQTFLPLLISMMRRR